MATFYFINIRDIEGVFFGKNQVKKLYILAQKASKKTTLICLKNGKKLIKKS